jgi:hypothetical protein
MASKTIPFTLNTFIKGKDEQGQYINNVTSDEANSKIKRLAMKEVIQERDKLLHESDWAEFPSVPMPDERRKKWRTY